MPWLRLRGSVWWCRFSVSPLIQGKLVPEVWPSWLDGLINPRTRTIKIEFTESLGQSEKAKAERAVVARRAWFDEAESEAIRLLSGEIKAAEQADPRDLAAVAAMVRADILAEDERLRSRGIGIVLPGLGLEIGPVEAPQPFRKGDGLTKDDLEFLKYAAERRGEALRLAVATARPDQMTVARAEEMAAKAGIAMPSHPEVRKSYVVAVLAAERLAWQDIDKRNQGEVVPTPSTVDPEAKQGVRISAALKSWSTPGHARGMRRKAVNSIREAAYAVRRWQEFHGDTRVGEITRRQVRDYRDALSKVPVALPDRLRALPLPEIIGHPAARGGKPPAAGTINKMLRLLSTIAVKAAGDSDLGDRLGGWSNPFAGASLDEDEQQQAPRAPFEISDLKTLFSDPDIRDGAGRGGQGETAKWLPLLGLFTGARLSELAQLQVGDIKRDPSGVIYIDITDGGPGNRSLKTSSSRRRVPLHPELVRCGFLAYVDSVNVGDIPWLFPRLVHARPDRRADAWGKWFGRKVRQLEIDDGGRKVFHSFRHTMMDQLRDGVTDMEMRYAITGHWEGRGRVPTGAGYGKGFNLDTLAAVINKVDFIGLDLRALHKAHDGSDIYRPIRAL